MGSRRPEGGLAVQIVERWQSGRTQLAVTQPSREPGGSNPSRSTKF